MSHETTAERYHQETKYSPEGMRRAGRGLDFDKQPSPFKRYPTGVAYDLARFLPEGDELRDDAELAAWRAKLPAEEQGLAALSHLLFFTNGVTAMVPYAGTPLLLRAAPSAGGLYPTELYVAVRGHALLPDGLYNYQVRDHSLVRYLTQDPWPRLLHACFGHPTLASSQLAVVMTGVHYRSAWRYEDRAYRRVMLDSGHVQGNLAMYAALVGLHASPIGGFIDTALDDALFLPGGEEGAIAVFALGHGAGEAGPTALPSPPHPCVDAPEGERLRALHEASRIPEGPRPEVAPASREPVEKYPFAVGEPLEAAPIAWEHQLGPTILVRRSTRAYSGEGLRREELAQLLDFAYRPELGAGGGEQHPGYFAPELLQTYVAVHDVAGLEPGCYHYNPARRALRQIRFTSLRKEVEYLALGQELAGAAGAVVFHTTDLPAAVARYGDRAYRYVHLDAGHLGQRLNVAAIRLGLGVSGIAGFFDDQVNELLGIPEAQAVVYLTTLGRPAQR